MVRLRGGGTGRFDSSERDGKNKLSPLADLRQLFGLGSSNPTSELDEALEGPRDEILEFSPELISPVCWELNVSPTSMAPSLDWLVIENTSSSALSLSHSESKYASHRSHSSHQYRLAA